MAHWGNSGHTAWEYVDGALLVRMLSRCVQRLGRMVDYLDSIDYFPVPATYAGQRIYGSLSRALSVVESVTELREVVRLRESAFLATAAGHQAIPFAIWWVDLLRSAENCEVFSKPKYVEGLDVAARGMRRYHIRPVCGEEWESARVAADAAADGLLCGDGLAEVLRRAERRAASFIPESVRRHPVLSKHSLPPSPGVVAFAEMLQGFCEAVEPP